MLNQIIYFLKKNRIFLLDLFTSNKQPRKSYFEANTCMTYQLVYPNTRKIASIILLDAIDLQIEAVSIDPADVQVPHMIQ